MNYYEPSDSSLKILDLRSRIPSPVSVYGYSQHPAMRQAAIYDDQAVPYFLMKKGYRHDTDAINYFLWINKIGRLTELVSGQQVLLPTGYEVNSSNRPIKAHPEA